MGSLFFFLHIPDEACGEICRHQFIGCPVNKGQVKSRLFFSPQKVVCLAKQPPFSPPKTKTGLFYEFAKPRNYKKIRALPAHADKTPQT